MQRWTTFVPLPSPLFSLGPSGVQVRAAGTSAVLIASRGKSRLRQQSLSGSALRDARTPRLRCVRSVSRITRPARRPSNINLGRSGAPRKDLTRLKSCYAHGGRFYARSRKPDGWPELASPGQVDRHAGPYSRLAPRGGQVRAEGTSAVLMASRGKSRLRQQSLSGSALLAGESYGRSPR